MKTNIPDEYWTGIGLLENECPWLVPEAIRKLESIDMSAMNVLEFGAGGSTLFFARRAKSVISFETSEEWYKKIMDEIVAKNINNVHISLNIKDLDLNRHYDIILIDSAGNRTEILNFVEQLDCSDIIIVIDNYYDYNMIVSGDANVELHDDSHWNGKGTMIIYPDHD
jgi:protein-L-isoaspartate O-methyltransferase